VSEHDTNGTTLRDTKAGYCQNCREDNHGLCMAPRCACTTGKHDMRPQPLSQRHPRPTPKERTMSNSTQAPPRSTPPAGAELDGDLVWEEPPPQGRRSSILPKALPKLDALRARPGAWARILSFDSKTTASGAKKRLAEAAGEGFEFHAGRNGPGSAVWGRFVGDS
jgi:hypothetical protein